MGGSKITGTVPMIFYDIANKQFYKVGKYGR